MEFINGICFITEDVPKMVKFYEKVLQTTVADMNDIHVEIKVNGGGLTIYSKVASIRDMGFNYNRYCGTGLTVASFKVDNVDEEFARLKKMDIVFMTTPTTYPWGSRSMHFRDPDGNIVCFVN